jgi:poly-beta-1,6-N-acetyl-D-glucosamine synthase
MQFFSSLWQNWMQFFGANWHSDFAQQHPFAYGFLFWAFVICFTYVLLVGAFVILLLITASLESLARNRESRAEDYDTLAASRFTSPVSIIVPAFNEEGGIVSTVQSLLRMDYPQFEIIIINDGSTDNTMEVLQSEFALEPREVFYRRTLPCKPIRAIYRSTRDARIIVVDKENGRKADSMNCGLNFCRYPYVLGVDGDSIYTRDALLKGIRLMQRDPEHVVGAVGSMSFCTNPETFENPDGTWNIERHWLANFQYVELVRSFMNSRLGWSRGNFMLCVSGAFMLWRRDLIMELGGMNSDFTCEDIEFTFRAHEHLRRHKKKFQILALPDVMVYTEAPLTPKTLISQRERWQRVTLETVWHYRHMLFRPRYGSTGMLGLPYYLIGECLAPFFQFLGVLSVAVALWYGLLEIGIFLAFLGVVSFLTAIFSVVSLWLQDAIYRRYTTRDLLYLMLLTPLELFLYRPLIMYANMKGTLRFLRGDKSWERFSRNDRGGNAPAAPGESPQRVAAETLPDGARITSSR